MLVLADATTGKWWAFLPPFPMAAQISPAQGEIYRDAALYLIVGDRGICPGGF